METLLEHSKPGETLDSLTEEFQVWLESNGLPPLSADELLAEETLSLSEAERLFLTEFCTRWEIAAEELALSE